MSLDWNVGKIKDYKEVCFETCTMNDTSYGRVEGERYLSSLTNSLIWVTMPLGMGEITEKNYEEFWWRAAFYERLHGAMRTRGDGEVYYTKADIFNHIGLTTNVSTETRAAWLRRILKHWKPESRY